jgi:hypothetical protein
MRWTSVKTRVPAKAGPYLVANRDAIWLETQHPSWWNYKDRSWNEYHGPKVTHWMRLPPMPGKRK